MTTNIETSQIDTEGTEYPVCPKCGKSNQDWWDGLDGDKNDGDSWDATCHDCEIDYRVTIYTSYSFDTELKGSGQA